MNYRHAYHAGNFADVFKHALLVLLIEALKRKSTPFCVLDTHAGAGRYDLDSHEAGQTGEAEIGIRRLWSLCQTQAVLAPYCDIIRQLNPDGVVRHYPGSPWCARALLRADDRLILIEQQPSEQAQLLTLFAGDSRVHVHPPMDGYAALKALLPPPERRGLVLIDPPYEADTNEYLCLEQGLGQALSRWPTGVYAMWYPLKDRTPATHLTAHLEVLRPGAVVSVEMEYPGRAVGGLSACGMTVVNPPWQWEHAAREVVLTLGAVNE